MLFDEAFDFLKPRDDAQLLGRAPSTDNRRYLDP